MRALRQAERDEVFEYLIDAGPGLDARDRRRGPPRRRPGQRISPNKLPAARWVEIIEASHRAGLRSTSTVMFGHIERAAGSWPSTCA